MKNKPKISFVTVSRNDNHGGDMLKRMRIFTKGLIHQCNKFGLDAELIFVEWNRDKSKPKLKEILPLPQQNDRLSIRFIGVPNEVHKRLKNHEKIPVFQMIGKNVGIRRAKANFVLCTNVDLLFSDSLFVFLSKKLDPAMVYRTNRCDIPKEIDESKSIEELLNYAENNILQRLGKNKWYPEISDTSTFLFHIPFYGLIKSLPNKFRLMIRKETVNDFLSRIDTDACGDFTMMHKSKWLEIQGYFELEAYSIHIDSIALICAHIIGCKQKILPYHACTYHISHSNGWELTDPIEKIYMDLDKPMLDWSSVYSLAKKMFENNELIQLNKANWGFADENFKEDIFEPGKEMQTIN
ncbi:MAG: hypothetical protein ACI9O4_001523 [Chitinophagales bacterium]|jgi:hypothetical protein